MTRDRGGKPRVPDIVKDQRLSSRSFKSLEPWNRPNVCVSKITAIIEHHRTGRGTSANAPRCLDVVPRLPSACWTRSKSAERIVTTPIPYQYLHMLNILLFFFVVTLSRSCSPRTSSGSRRCPSCRRRAGVLRRERDRPLHGGPVQLGRAVPRLERHRVAHLPREPADSRARGRRGERRDEARCRGEARRGEDERRRRRGTRRRPARNGDESPPPRRRRRAPRGFEITGCGARGSVRARGARARGRRRPASVRRPRRRRRRSPAPAASRAARCVAARRARRP